MTRDPSAPPRRAQDDKLKLARVPSFVASLAQMHCFEMQWLAMQPRPVNCSVSLEFPAGNKGEVFVVAHCFALCRLMFLAEMRATRFVAFERIDDHKFGELKEVRDPPGALERLIVCFVLARYAHAFP